MDSFQRELSLPLCPKPRRHRSAGPPGSVEASTTRPIPFVVLAPKPPTTEPRNIVDFCYFLFTSIILLPFARLRTLAFCTLDRFTLSNCRRPRTAKPLTSWTSFTTSNSSLCKSRRSYQPPVRAHGPPCSRPSPGSPSAASALAPSVTVTRDVRFVSM
jgi:hypothetical protein